MGFWKKYECEGQMDIFDFIDDPNEEQKKNESKVKEIETKEILRGSGFENGKERIYNFFNEYHTEKEQVDFLKKEYGIGGWSMDEGFCDHDANGIDIKFDPPIGKTRSVHIGWPMVARRIKELISGGLYKPKEPQICKLSNHTCNKEELWKVADTLDEIICPHICCNICFQKQCGARCNGSNKPKEKTVCSKTEECEAYPSGCGGTIEPCRFGGPFNWSNKTEKLEDVHIDREGRPEKAPSWMNYKRCENCKRWQRYDIKEQPPTGWGVMGYCMEHKEKCSTGSYCDDFEDKNEVKNGTTNNKYR